MTKDVKQKLTLDRPVTYQIKVPGHLDGSWTEWDGRMTVAVESEDNRPAGHHPDRNRRPGRFARAAAPALLPGLAVDFGQYC